MRASVRGWNRETLFLEQAHVFSYAPLHMIETVLNGVPDAAETLQVG
jgi:hypothetical protein